ncbi:hypothetical protein K474DRAFT_1595789 [Panus rudis PR-1116 ss-1]|nr:hypothetical protein K474DRAFT_1595789 [Panus rudis PR-1116 ss-1]
MAAKMFSLASCVMLFYDMALTFGDEVEKIWKQRFTGATILWFMVTFHDRWRESVCHRYILYPEILKIFTAFAIGLIFILRLYSIYSRSYTILVVFGLLLLAELATKIWAFTDGTMLALPPQLTGCILVGKSAPGARMVYTWVAELVFDSLVFFATLYRTIYLYRTSELGPASSLIRLIMRDGRYNLSVIWVQTVNLVLTVIQEDLKAVNASFSTLITSLMVSRLMLNLRGEVLRTRPVIQYHWSGSDATQANSTSYGVLTSKYSVQEESRTFERSIIGNLGAPLDQWFDDEDGSHEVERRPEEGENEGVEMQFRTPQPIAVEITEEVVVDDGRRLSAA